MIKRIQTIQQDNDRGFTLIELLIVIVILGILAAIVVFSVGGVTDRGQTTACDTSKKTIQTAEEAFFAQDQGNPAHSPTQQDLKTPGFLHDIPRDFTVTLWQPDLSRR